MRPTATTQNPLRNPLNRVLSTEAQVRLLRVLCVANGPLSVADAANRAELTQAGARKALKRLADTGFVVRVGAGRDQQFALRREDPLTRTLDDLFRVEQSRFADLLRSLRIAFEESAAPPHSAWIRAFPSDLGEPLEVGVLQGARRLHGFLRDVRPVIAEVESRFDLTIELTGFSRADLPDLSNEDFTLIAGVPPLADERGGPLAGHRSHQELDRRSLDLAARMADLVDQDPSLIERARRHLERALDEGHGAADADLREWLQILESYPITRLLKFLTSNSARASRLRQSSPFYAVVTHDERKALHEHAGAGT
jgi:DNA-binding MarR family transcriptional regulator